MPLYLERLTEVLVAWVKPREALRWDITFNFKSGASPSKTNTGFAPSSSKHDVRKNKFLVKPKS